MKNIIILIGVSGSGKSTLGKALSEKLGILFIDGDDFHSQDNIEKMKKFGLLVGQAFQLRDDLFGYLSFDTGKPSLNDFKQAKITLPLIHSLSKVGKTERKKIINDLKNFKSIDKIIDFVKVNKGIEYSEKIMNDLITQSREILHSYPNSEYKRSLESLLDYIIRRNV